MQKNLLEPLPASASLFCFSTSFSFFFFFLVSAFLPFCSVFQRLPFLLFVFLVQPLFFFCSVHVLPFFFSPKHFFSAQNPFSVQPKTFFSVQRHSFPFFFLFSFLVQPSFFLLQRLFFFSLALSKTQYSLKLLHISFI